MSEDTENAEDIKHHFMKINPETIMANSFVGGILISLQFGTEGMRAAALGSKITKVRFGFNDAREDAGLWLYVESLDEPIFVFDNEEIEVMK